MSLKINHEATVKPNLLAHNNVKDSAPFQLTAEKIEALRADPNIMGIVTVPDNKGRMIPAYISFSPAEYTHTAHILPKMVRDFPEMRGEIYPDITTCQVPIKGCATCDATYFSIHAVEDNERLGLAKVLPFTKENNYFYGYWGVNRMGKAVEVPSKYQRYGYTIDKVVIDSLLAPNPKVGAALTKAIMQKFQPTCGANMLVTNLDAASDTYREFTKAGFENAVFGYKPTDSAKALYLNNRAAANRLLEDIYTNPVSFPTSDKEREKLTAQMGSPFSSFQAEVPQFEEATARPTEEMKKPPVAIEYVEFEEATARPTEEMKKPPVAIEYVEFVSTPNDFV